ncbi:hypothetical protein ACI65C_009963 [Semiaphis heraclei]
MRTCQMFAALSVMTACTMAIPIFVEGGPRSQSSESAENYKLLPTWTRRDEANGTI